MNQPIPTILLDLDDNINATDDADISMNYISKEEIKEGLRGLANNKAAGLDFIPAELLKWGGVAMADELTKIPNIVWHTVKVPDGNTFLIIARKMSSPTKTITEEHRCQIKRRTGWF